VAKPDLEIWQVWNGLAIFCTIEIYIIPLENNVYLHENYYSMLSALIRAIINSRELNYSYLFYISMYPTHPTPLPTAETSHILCNR
jgi:hypothetical protein